MIFYNGLLTEREYETILKNQKRRSRQIEKEKEDREKVYKKYNIKDLYSFGYGWWESIEQQVDIMQRKKAWHLLDVCSYLLADWLGHYTIDPAIGKQMEAKEIKALLGLGDKAVEVLHSLTKEQEEKWLSIYNNPEFIEHSRQKAKENFKRTEENRRKRL